MENLISRKTAIEALGERPENWTDTPVEIEAVRSYDNAIDNLKSIPSVPAVPLEPLCQWLAGYAAPPQYAMDHVYDMNILNGPSERYEALKYHFRELLKSGLMDTEGEDAEKEDET